MSEEAKKTGSPVLGERFLKEKAKAGEESFSSAGAVNKTGFLTLLVIGGACLAWSEPGTFFPALIPLLIINLVVGLVVCFVPSTAFVLAPAYAVLEGLLLGTISVLYERLYQGIVFQAAAGTLGILAVMSAGYASGLFKFGARGKAIIGACTLGLFLTYLFALGARFFGYEVGFLHEATPLGIAFSVFALVIAALNFSLDFDFIGEAQSQGLSKRMEWYAAFGVLVTLVWVYLEMLRLLSKLKQK